MKEKISDLIEKSNLRDIKKNIDNFNLKLKDENGAYPIFYAALRGDLSVFEYLLKKKSFYRGSDRDKNSILFYAVKGNNPEIIKILFEKNIRIEHLNKLKAPSIFYIDKNTKIEIIELFKKRGFDINKKYKIFFHKKCFKERNLLYYAIKKQNFKLIKYLVESKVKLSVLYYDDCEKRRYRTFFYVLKYSALKTIKFFIDLGINTKLSKSDINLIFDYYVKENKYSEFKYVSEYLNISLKELSFGKNKEYDIMSYSVINNRKNFVKYLLKRGFEYDIDSRGCKPINYCVIYSDLEMFLLFKHDINHISCCEEDLMYFAASYKKKDIVKFLLENKDYNINFRYEYSNKLDFGEDIKPVLTFRGVLISLIENDFTVSYIKKAVKRGVEITLDDVVLAVYKKNFKVLKYLLANSDLNLDKRNYRGKLSLRDYVSSLIDKF